MRSYKLEIFDQQGNTLEVWEFALKDKAEKIGRTLAHRYGRGSYQVTEIEHS